MRSESAVRHKLRQVVYRHLQKRLRENFKQVGTACRYNLQAADSYGVCSHPEVVGDGQHTILCDERHPAKEVWSCARHCPFWTPRQTKEEVKADFEAFLRESDVGVLAYHFPDAVALLWVLGEDSMSMLENDLSDLSDDPPETPKPFVVRKVSDDGKPPLLGERLWRWFRGGPVRGGSDD